MLVTIHKKQFYENLLTFLIVVFTFGVCCTFGENPVVLTSEDMDMKFVVNLEVVLVENTGLQAASTGKLACDSLSL